MGNEFDAIALVIAAIVGGIAGGAGAVVAFGAGVRAVLNSPVLIANGENLANSFPASVNGLLVDLGSLLVKLNDRVPEADKTVNNTQHQGLG
jgi:hypothetical protein